MCELPVEVQYSIVFKSMVEARVCLAKIGYELLNLIASILQQLLLRLGQEEISVEITLALVF